MVKQACRGVWPLSTSVTSKALRTSAVEKHESDYLKENGAVSSDRLSCRFSLAFSGGGIRSAAICLGVVRELARQDLIRNIDYLSTVSGGGYTGCLLSSLIWRQGVDEATQKLKEDGGFTNPQSPLYHLRSYSNYLTPRLGLFSVDSLAGVALLLRNLVINWLVFLPWYLLGILFAILLAVGIYSFRDLVIAPPGNDSGIWFLNKNGLLFTRNGLLYVTIALAGWSAVEMLRLRPDWIGSKTRGQSRLFVVHGAGFFLAGLILALLISGSTKLDLKLSDLLIYALVFVGLAALHAILLLEKKIPRKRDRTLDWRPLSVLAFSVLAWVISALAGIVLLFFALGFVFDKWGKEPFRWSDSILSKFVLFFDKWQQGPLIWSDAVLSNLALLVEKWGRGPLLWIDAVLSHAAFAIDKWVYGIWGQGQLELWQWGLLLGFVPLLVALMNLIVDVIYVLCTNRLSGKDMEHEWLAYANAGQLRLPVTWFLFTSAVAAGIYLAQEGLPLDSFGTMLLGGTTAISGLLTLWLGRAKTTIATVKTVMEGWKEYYARLVLSVSVPVFLFSATAACAYGLVMVIQYIVGAEKPNEWLLPIFWVMVGLLAVGLVTSLIVDINEFSLHSTYKNRLVRTFLGASRPRKPDDGDVPDKRPEEDKAQRQPNFLTGFDDSDDFPLAHLAKPPEDKQDGGQPLPYLHVINMAMNVLRARDLAIQERRALPFMATQLHIGSRRLRPAGDKFENAAPGCFRKAEEYQGLDSRLVTCGNAMAISGAAVNSNMGYHSSSLLSLLLTIFNVRLGAWLSNPRSEAGIVRGGEGQKTKLWAKLRATPVASMMREAFGITNEDMPYVQLSDGGHFDNLGLYELLARRHKVVIAVDAGADPHSQFSDLGIAAKLAQLDLGAKIIFEPADKENLTISQDGTQKATHVLAKLDYGDGRNGVLLYLKSGMVGDEPVSVEGYKRSNSKFPHDSTADQWMGETQFNAYMLLGEHMMRKALEDLRYGLPGDLSSNLEYQERGQNGG